ncbi:hypothetical protein BD311DRAFT_740282 [Dichomitus squalens]|uniref:Uncharacterized protein n=1 Tax=Dichomitus squalens TaxID=114155 RepID=A0A4Q9MHN7_9APHY|nr:hypothetical protein BD311DRAFT_740282 [Dichomitus squalens]
MSSSGPPITALPHISIDTSIGAMLIGTFITLILYGVVVHQVYRYSRTYSLDKAGIKFAVYATFYYYLVSNYLNPSVLLYPTRSSRLSRYYMDSKATLATTIVEIQSGPFTGFVPKTWVIALASGLAVVADIILTTVLIIALRQSRSGIKSLRVTKIQAVR